MRKPSIKQLKGFAKEEAKTSKLYASLGFKKQAKQEKEHSEFFKKRIKRIKNAKTKIL